MMLALAPAFFELLTYQTVLSDENSYRIFLEQEKLTTFGTTCLFMLLPMFVCWVVYAIGGRKNLYRKSIARLLGHLCLGLLAAVMTFCADHGNDTPLLIAKLFWSCYPYGLIIVAGWTMKIGSVIDYVPSQHAMDIAALEWEFGDKEELRERGIAGALGLLILGFLCGLVGIICCPVILIKDIVTIVRCRVFA